MLSMIEPEFQITPPAQDDAEPEWPWYLVHIHSNVAEHTMRTLREAGYEVYRPMERFMRLPPQRTLSAAQRRVRFTLAKPALRPLWTGYAFVRYPDFDPYELFRLAGIRGILVAGDRPYPATDMVEALRRKEIDGAIPSETPVAELVYEIGEVVRIGDGPFTGYNGTVEMLDEAGRLGLLISLFGRKCRMTTSVDQVEKL